MNKRLLGIIALTAFWAACSSPTQNTEESTTEGNEEAQEEVVQEEKPSQYVYFVNLEDGAEVTSPVKVQMGVEGMQVEPAGELKEGYGHHHIIIDGTFVPEGSVVPMTETSIHYGKGQTETELELTPGEHTLTMQFADGFHSSYGEAMSKTITVKVAE